MTIRTKGILLLFVSVALFALSIYFRGFLTQFKSLGLLGIFLINFFGSATIFLPAPAIVSVVAGSLIYPPFAVALVSALGASFGDMLGFLFGLSGKHIFIKNHHVAYIVLKDMFKKFGGITIFLFAFIPNPFFDAVGILGGVFSYSPVRFFIFLFAGRLLRDLILAYSGAALGGN